MFFSVFASHFEDGTSSPTTVFSLPTLRVRGSKRRHIRVVFNANDNNTYYENGFVILIMLAQTTLVVVGRYFHTCRNNITENTLDNKIDRTQKSRRLECN